MTTQTTTDTVNIGIIGSGNRGIACFGGLITARDDARVAALCDPNPARMQNAVERLGQTPNCYTSIDEMLTEENLDGVIITTPDYLHADHAVAALQCGVRHILVDKPLATTAEGCMRVIRAMHENNGQVAVGFNLRHLPVIHKIKELIDSGTIGELMMIENREFYDGGRTYMARWNRKYALSGGLWVHKGSHDFDIFNWWNSQGTPVRVSASAGVNALRPDKIPFEVEEGKPVGPNCSSCAYKDICPDFFSPEGGLKLHDASTAQVDGYVADLCVFLSDKDTHDNGIALVEYDNNVRASHMECFICNFTDRLYTIIGDRGILIASAENPTQIEFRPRWGENQIIEVNPAKDDTQTDSLMNHGGADPLLLENFVAGIKGAAPHSSTVRDGIRAVAVGEAAERAWRNHRTVDIAEFVDLHDPSLIV